MSGTSPKCRQRGPKERGPYTAKPVQARVIADRLAGYSNRRIGREEGTRELLFPPLPYVAVYRVKEQSIEVLRIYHTAQDRP